MTDSGIPSPEREMMASMQECVRLADETRRRERQVNRRLARRNLRLERSRSGYAIADRISTLCEAHGLTLAQAEAWAAAHVSGGPRA